MQTASSRSPDLAIPAFSNSHLFEEHRRRGFSELIHRLAIWREAAMVRRALGLAGQPNSILDIPCGAGRLWPVLLEKANRLLIGADGCADMLAIAQATFPSVGNRLRYLRTLPEAIELHDCAVDCIFCAYLFPLLGHTMHRQQVLREFHRVTRDTLILSLWVDGNVQAWRRRASRRQPVPIEHELPPRFVLSRQQIEFEFAAVGFDVLGYVDYLPRWHMTRIYTLRKR